MGWRILVLQAETMQSPGPSNARYGQDQEANWLPAPKGPFNLNRRISTPSPEALGGKWNPPAIKKVQ